MLSTRHKIFIARSAYRIIHGVRRLLQLHDRVVVTRGGLRWELDLGEGIDFSIYLLGGFERSTIAAYSRVIRPGDVVMDIGANIGAHTLPFARLVSSGGKVIAFEPTAYAFGKLERNVSHNPDLAARLRLERIMLTDAEDAQPVPQLHSSWPLRAENRSRHATHLGVLADTTGAQATTLDEYVRRHRLERVDFLKIDVDGNECHVLRGSTQTLARYRPGILIEFMPYGLDEAGESFAHLIALLKTTGYHFFRIPHLVQLPDDEDALRRLVPTGGGINVLCRHGREIPTQLPGPIPASFFRKI
jgi:FkbM family methyltransferase